MRAQVRALQACGRSLCTYVRGSVLEDYERLVSSATLQADASQAEIVVRLSALCDELQEYKGLVASYHHAHADYQARKAELSQHLQRTDSGPPTHASSSQDPPLRALQSLQNLYTSIWNSPERDAARARRDDAVRAAREQQLLSMLGPPPEEPMAPRGVYIHGTVGSGKSFVMDMFYRAVERHALLPFRRRIHFNTALLELAALTHRFEQKQAGHGLPRAASPRASGPSPAPAPQRVDPDGTGTEVPGGAAPQAPVAASTQNSVATPGRPVFVPGDEVPVVREAPVQVPADVLAAASEGLPASSGGGEAPGGTAGRGGGSRADRVALVAARRRARQLRTLEEREAVMAERNADVLVAAARGLLLGGPAAIDPVDAASRPAPMAGLLCFDELQVINVYEAIALKAVLETAFRSGFVVVTTSNRAPWQLDSQGLHEAAFSHFISSLLTHCDTAELAAGTDYREALLQQQELQESVINDATGAVQGHRRVGAVGGGGLAGDLETCVAAMPSYLFPDTPEEQRRMDGIWDRICGAVGPAQSTEVGVMFGRKLLAPGACGGYARFTFDELCSRPVGASDFVALAQAFHTVLLDHVPAMSMEVRDKARRFILLVDELYNEKVRLICCAAVSPRMLFAGADDEEPIVDLEGLQFEGAVPGAKLRRDLTAEAGVSAVGEVPEEQVALVARLGGEEEKFAFKRAVSRLLEMQTQQYISSCKQR